MRIEGSSARSAVDNLSIGGAELPGSGNSANVTGARDADEANFSAEAQLIASMQQKVAAAPEVRENRVAQLRAAMQQGTYNVSDEQIARAMLNDLQSFGAGKQS